MHRRTYLKTLASTAAIGTIGTASAGHSESDWVAKPSHVTLEYDEAMLKTYQPLFVTDSDTRKRHKGLYGYVARSDAYDYDVCCYWSQLTHQDGLPLARADSHLGDHEPLYVFVDPDGTVGPITYTGYHHFAAETHGDRVQLTEDRANHPTHATFEVVNPWHHYQQTTADGAFLDLSSWLDIRTTWRDNGFYDPTEPEAIENPARMLSRKSWWRDGSRDAFFAHLWYRIGFHTDSTDNLKID